MRASLNKQRGVVLLIMAVVMIMAAIAFLLTRVSVDELKIERQNDTATALKNAKQALLAYAVTNWAIIGEGGKLGKLPCPDYNNAPAEGQEDGNCGSAFANAIGYFPWRTVGVDLQADSSGSCLLYAVSPAYKKSPVSVLNPDSYGQFQIVDSNGLVIQGASPEDRPVAVIIAPGYALPGQARNNNDTTVCGFDYNNIGAYLDNNGVTDNAAINTGINNIIDRFVQMSHDSDTAANPLNDRLVTITYDEYWNTMQSTIESAEFNNRMQELTEALAMCFAEFGNNNTNHLPMPALLNLAGGEYRWRNDYQDSGNFTSGFSGRLPYNVARAHAELLNATDDDVITNNSYCDGLELASTAGPDNIRFSDDAGGDIGAFLDRWHNWQDHFFYAISKAHNPNVATVNPCAGNCITVGGVEYAGVVMFAGLKNGQTRYAPPFDAALAGDGVDDKDDVINYLEELRNIGFPNDAGNEAYAISGAGSNDILYCIRTDMSVVECL